MAYQKRERLYELLARVQREGGADRVAGMHAVKIVEIYDDQTQEIISAVPGSATPVDWAGLVALMHKDDLSAFMAAAVAASGG